MPISYPIPVYSLSGRMLLWAVSNILWFYSKKKKKYRHIFCSKTNRAGLSVLISHSDCPRKMIHEAIPLYLPAVCSAGFWLTEGMMALKILLMLTH